MDDSSPRAGNALSPYYPSEVPSIRGNGRLWFTLLVLAMFFVSGVLTFVDVFF